MLNRIKSFFESNFSSYQNLRILVAVSGGKDSMALAHALHKLGFEIAIAHCNYHLRGKDSDLDEELVKNFAAQHHIPFYVKSFETKTLLDKEEISLQMLARRLRYDFFDELQQTHKFDYVATAHHAADNFENFFIYLYRNSPDTAWKGIAPLTSKTLRPNLYTPPNEIITYLKEHQINWREDVSNSHTHYLRNKVRHWLCAPLLEEDPALLTEFAGISREVRASLSAENLLYQHFVEQHIQRDETGGWELSAHLAEQAFVKRWFYEQGFNKQELEKMLNASTGASFKHENGVLRKERIRYVFSPSSAIAQYSFALEEGEVLHFSTARGRFWADYMAIEAWTGQYEKGAFYFDADKLAAGVVVRNWQQGDRMTVFGLKGTKKVSDVFTDQKVEQRYKTEIPVVLSGTEIIAVAGLKRSNLALIDDHTQNILRIRFE